MLVIWTIIQLFNSFFKTIGNLQWIGLDNQIFRELFVKMFGVGVEGKQFLFPMPLLKSQFDFIHTGRADPIR